MKVVERLNQKDFDRFYALYLASFGRENSDRRRKLLKIRYQNSTPYGVKENHRLVGGLYRLPLSVNFHNIIYKMGGIGVVMTAEDYRRQGIADLLLKNILQEMYQDGTELSYLDPFSYSFYRKFGYEQVFATTKYTIPASDLPTLSRIPSRKNLGIHNFKEVVPELKEYYEEVKPAHLGGLVRPDWWWGYLALRYADTKVILSYDDSGEVLGYVTYKLTGENCTIYEWEVKEDNPDTFKELFECVISLKQDVSEISYLRKSQNYVAGVLAEPKKVETTITPYMSARIINVEKVFKRYPFQSKFDSVVIKIIDPIISENDGLFEVSFDGKNCSIKHLSDSKTPVDFEIKISQLTKLMLGGQDFGFAVKVGKLIKYTKKSYSFGKALICARPELIDYF